MFESTPGIDDHLRKIYSKQTKETLKRYSERIGIRYEVLKKRAKVLRLVPAKSSKVSPEIARELKEKVFTSPFQMTLGQFAEYVGISVSTLRKTAILQNWCRRSISPRQWTEDEEEFLSSNTHQTPQALAAKWKNKFGVHRAVYSIRKKMLELHGSLEPDLPWYTTSQLASYLGVSVNTIHQWINTGVLRFKQRDADRIRGKVIHQNWLRAAILERKIKVNHLQIPRDSWDWFLDLIAEPINPHRNTRSHAGSCQKIDGE